MKVFLREFSDTERELHYTQSDLWVRKTVATVDEAKEILPLDRLTDYDITFRKVDEVFEVEGEIKTQIALNCSRCTTSYPYDILKKFNVLYSKDPKMAGLAESDPDTGKLSGHNQGHAFSSDVGLETDYEISHISQEFIDLSEVLAEQIHLLIPYQPLCQATCKGLCVQCGKDLNQGSCQCDQLSPTGPLATLKDWKLKLFGSSKK